jgi:hypothetical protein
LLAVAPFWCGRATRKALSAGICVGSSQRGGIRARVAFEFWFVLRRQRAPVCELRGAARWEGEKFVNTYEEMINGKRTKVQDIWSDIRPNSHTLTEARDIGNGIMLPYVVSHETRR